MFGVQNVIPDWEVSTLNPEVRALNSEPET